MRDLLLRLVAAEKNPCRFPNLFPNFRRSSMSSILSLALLLLAAALASDELRGPKSATADNLASVVLTH